MTTRLALRVFVGSVALLLAVCTATGAARAATIDSRARAAKTACLAGDYTKGVAILAELFVRTNDPTYIYNQGRCFEQNGRYEEAIFRFREYQRKRADVQLPPDEGADKHIADCQALLEKERPAVAFPAAKPADAAPVSAQPPPAPAAPPARSESAPADHVAAVAPAPPSGQGAALAPMGSAPAEAVVAQAAPVSTGAGLRIAGITTAALGVASVAAGVLLQLKANSLADDLGASPSSYSRDKESTRKTYKTVSLLGYGVGAALVAGGGVLYYLGYRQGRLARMAVVPVGGPGELGLAMQGGF